ncbi:MAG TPA: Sir2 family NAD-dependent protein deacetylase [Acidimicrobiales bacterium]|jgi:NAD-dependent deacetylase|nr:Sir2 family NAD-dependent protein deacetylase [Acidimicrobiales bacterium]
MGDGVSTEAPEIERVRGWVHTATRILALTGAGISTDSGIPDFRGPQGVWTKNPAAERTSSLQHYLGDPEVRRQSWQNRLHHPAWSARPNPGHAALVTLEQRGQLAALVTQNIDELHQRAGNTPGVVVELHGTMHHALCWSCGERTPMPEVLERVRAGEEDPACHCGGILKSATISFGQSLDREVLDRAQHAAATCDLVLAIGSSLTVHPAAGLVPAAWQAGARVVIINAEPTPYDDLADAVLRSPTSEVVPAIVG